LRSGSTEGVIEYHAWVHRANNEAVLERKGNKKEEMNSIKRGILENLAYYEEWHQIQTHKIYFKMNRLCEEK
jgi:hypothetical protein